MESKKLQQLQQANSHLAPQPMPHHDKPPPPPFHHNHHHHQSGGQAAALLSSYQQHATSTPLTHPPSMTFQHQSYQSTGAAASAMDTSFSQMNLAGGLMQSQPAAAVHNQQQQQPYQQLNHHHLHQQQQKQQQPHQSHHNRSHTNPGSNHQQAIYASEQLYQNNRDRLYQQAAAMTGSGGGAGGRSVSLLTGSQIHLGGNIGGVASAGPVHHSSSSTSSQPLSAMQQQYQQLQQAKMQQQIQTQNEAAAQQQRTFALRQQLNPPVAGGTLAHGQSQMSIMSKVQQQQQHQQIPGQQPLQSHSQSKAYQQNHQSFRNAPPSTLNLTSQFQPASGPMKLTTNMLGGDPNAQQQNSMYGAAYMSGMNVHHQHAAQQQQHLQQQQQQQIKHQSHHMKSPSEQTPIIQQNHPGLVVNQACQTQLSGTKSANADHSTTTTSTSTAISNVTHKSPSDDTSTSSPSHASGDRRKSAGSGVIGGGSSSGAVHTLKSPVTKRAPSAPVTLSGWLYKQGSDGLKVWRKRWFVLAEYCLFYYKGPEEEKLLGSILLPSYTVSAASAGGDDRVHRKYAFKCEHQNMRTYWLAAEQPEAMGQWVRALTAATLMQGSAESSVSITSPLVATTTSGGENSDSGIHTYQSQVSGGGGGGGMKGHSSLEASSMRGGPVTPASDANGGGPQPLYANAPPKPRRANDGGYSSPSPENSIEMQQYEANFDGSFGGGVGGRHAQVKSPLTTAGANATTMSAMQRLMQQQQHHHHTEHQQQQQLYGASVGKSAFPGVEPSTHDLQQLQDIYATEMQPVTGADSGNNPFRMDAQPYDDQGAYQGQYYGDLTPTDDLALMYMQQQQQQQQQMTGGKYRGPQHPGNSSSSHADLHQFERQLQQQQQLQRIIAAERQTPDSFGRSRTDLERRYLGTDYEDIYNVGGSGQQHQQLAMEAAYRRPMSPPMPVHIKYVPNMAIDAELAGHMKEPHRAAHIRSKSHVHSVARPHSADFLEFEARHMDTSRMVTEAPVRAPRPKSSLDINRGDNMYYSEASYAEKMRQSALYLQKTPSTNNAALLNESIYSPGIGSSYSAPRQQSHLETEFERITRLELEQIHQQNQNTSLSVPRASHRPSSRNAHIYQQQQLQQQQQQQQLQQQQQQQQLQHIQQLQQQQQHEQFLRSASARLPGRKQGADDNGASGSNATTPLSAAMRDGERKREESMKRLLEWKQRMLQSPLTRKGAPMSLATPQSSSAVAGLPHGEGADMGSSGALQRSRSESHAAGYASYSSDDEDEAQIPPAGRPLAPSRSSTTTTTTTTNTTTFQSHPQSSSTPHTTGHILAHTDFDNTNHKTPTHTPPPTDLPIVDAPSRRDFDTATATTAPIPVTPPQSIIRPKPPRPPPKPGSGQRAILLDQIELPDTYRPVYAHESILLGAPLPAAAEASHEDVPVEAAEEFVDDIQPAERPDEIVDEVADKVDDDVDSVADADADDVDMEPIMSSTIVGDVDAQNEAISQPDDAAAPTSIARDEDEDDQDDDVDDDDDDDDDRTCEYTDDDLDEALQSDADERPVDRAFATIGPPPSTMYGTTSDEPQTDANENPYMLMTPRKSILSASENNIHLQSMSGQLATTSSTALTAVTTTAEASSLMSELRDDSTYVEMFINNGKAASGSTVSSPADDYKSTYELMSFGAPAAAANRGGSSHKRTESEPVYMELSHLRMSGNYNSRLADPAPKSAITGAIIASDHPTKEIVAALSHSHADGRSTIRKSVLKSSKLAATDAKPPHKKQQQQRSAAVAANINKKPPQHHNLPDIVKPSLNKKMVANTDDSSDDADDESTAAKHPAPIDAHRSRSRFSLSDTFRPASYYLGASTSNKTTTTSYDFADSSDGSEVMSPPPIPASPPPLQSLASSNSEQQQKLEEEAFAADHCDTIRRRSSISTAMVGSEKLPKGLLHSSSSSLNSIKKEAALNKSRLSLPDQFAKWQQQQHQHHQQQHQSAYLLSPTLSSGGGSHHLQHISSSKQHSESSYSYHTDNSSVASSEYEAASGGASAQVELRINTTNTASNSELRLLKRRPLSEDSLCEIAEMGRTFDENIEAAAVAASSNSPDLDVYLQTLADTHVVASSALYQNTAGLMGGVGNVPFIRPPEVFRGDSDMDAAFYGNIRFQRDEPAPPPPALFETQMATASGGLSAALLFYDSLEEKEFNAPTTATSEDAAQPVAAIVPHSRTSSTLSDSVPYYYADLGKDSGVATSTTTTPPKMLNNLRDMMAQKRPPSAGIALIQNPIAKENLVGTLALVNDAKDRHIENKNLFGAGEKNVCKSRVVAVGAAYATNRLYGVKPINTNSSAAASATATTVVQALAAAPPVDSSGELHWEEDDMWRESLRRVSHRHARSLDALDRIEATMPRRLQQQQQPNAVVRPEAMAAKQLQTPRNSGRFGPLPPLPTEASLTATLRSRRPAKRTPPAVVVNAPVSADAAGVGELDEHDVYVQLMMAGQQHQTAGDMYERLKQDNVPNSRKSIEINRDLIRQWDSMSSGLMKSGTSSGVVGHRTFGGGGGSGGGVMMMADSNSSRGGGDDEDGDDCDGGDGGVVVVECGGGAGDESRAGALRGGGVGACGVGGGEGGVVGGLSGSCGGAVVGGEPLSRGADVVGVGWDAVKNAVGSGEHMATLRRKKQPSGSMYQQQQHAP